jgi:hypothetical protein
MDRVAGGVVALVVAMSCSGPSTPDTQRAAVDSVVLAPSTITLNLLQEQQLTATPKANGQTLTDRAVSWSSADQTVASVSSTGTVRGVRAGVTTVTATSEGKSASASVTVNNAAPTLSGIAPSSVLAGAAPFTLTVTGTGFVNGSVVQWNGVPRTTTFGSSTQLSAAITAGDITASGTAQVSVSTPSPGGGTSASLPFTIVAPGPLVLSTHVLTSAKFDDTLTLTVTRDGRPLTPSLALRAERRWLTESPVVSTTALGNTRIVTKGVGRAVVSVTAEGLTDSVVVDVALARPLVTAVTGPSGRTHLGAGDTLVVRGYGMHLVTSAQLFAPSLGLTTAPSDSANLRLVTTVDPAVTCSGRPASYVLTPNGVDLNVAATTPYTRARAGELSLAVGAAQMLSGAAASCIRLAPVSATARYLLAFVDSRRIKQAETQFEVPAPADMTVRVEDRTTASAISATAVAAMTSAPHAEQRFATAPTGRASTPASSSALTSSSALADQPFQACATTPTAAAWAVYCRTTPWTVGSTFNYQPIVSGRAAGPAHIIAVSPNAVAAVFDADQAFVQPAALVRIQATLDYLSSRYLGVLQQQFKTSRSVVTSPGSNQLVIMFEGGNSANTIRSPGDNVVPGGTWSMVSMLASATNCYGAPASCTFSGVDEIMVHETTHTFQFLWNVQYRNGASPFGQTWSAEGGAALQELLAPLDRNAVAWDANTSFESLPVGDPRRTIAPYANGSLQYFTLGYRASAAFMRYLIQRLVKEKGVSFTDALYDVHIGAMEGWYGIGFSGVIQGPGLVSRMRARFGSGWDPVQSMLEWTMADAADDLTANPLFQDLTARIAPREVGGVYVHNGFKPYAGIGAGTGSAGETTLPSGNTGVFQLDDANVGGSWRTTTTSSGSPITAQVSWLVLRVR